MNDRTSFSVLEDGNLTDVYENDCQVLDSDLDEFCLMPKEFDGRFLVLMWKPLAESGIWRDLREFDRSAIKRFEDLRVEYGHIDASIN